MTMFVAAVTLLLCHHVGAFVTPSPQQRVSSFRLQAAAKLSDLPTGISPFEKGFAPNVDVSGQLRKKALSALTAAKRDNLKLLEVEFPPLLGEGKSQFDDFDNISELNQNRDWCVQLLPTISDDKIWFCMPDLQELQLCKEEWTGQRFRQAAQFTTIQAATQEYSPQAYSKPWGATLADAVKKNVNDKILGDEDALDAISAIDNPPSLHVVCQPGNGGPVEDWINCEIMHNNADNNAATLIVNGALDKVRDGYYPAIFFPKLAATVDRFYKQFEPILYLKPVTDKGVYGWIYRVYPEPWQVILQTVKTGRNDRQYVENTVVYSSDKRPTFAEAVQKLLAGAAAVQSK